MSEAGICVGMGNNFSSNEVFIYYSMIEVKLSWNSCLKGHRSYLFRNFFFPISFDNYLSELNETTKAFTTLFFAFLNGTCFQIQYSQYCCTFLRRPGKVPGVEIPTMFMTSGQKHYGELSVRRRSDPRQRIKRTLPMRHLKPKRQCWQRKALSLKLCMFLIFKAFDICFVVPELFISFFSWI